MRAIEHLAVLAVFLTMIIIVKVDRDVFKSYSSVYIDFFKNSSPNHPMNYSISIPSLSSTSIIVLKDYKLMWFLNPKCASTSTRFLLYKLMHPEQPDTKAWHTNKDFVTLRDFSSHEASAMLLSDDWTRVITLRDPKDRLLSAYLGKEVRVQWQQNVYKLKQQHRDHNFRLMCCNEEYVNITTKIINDMNVTTQIINDDDCWRHNFSFPEFVNVTEKCRNIHWDPQLERVSYHPEFINFFIDFNTLANDTARLLKKLNVTIDLGRQSVSTGSNTTFNEYYTPELVKIVEERYSQDYKMLQKYIF